MGMRIKSTIIFNSGVRFLKNEFFRKISSLSGKNLYLPPNLIDLRLTLKCNLKCQQCPEWKMSGFKELSTEQWKNIILDIKSYIGPYFLRFYGGEPFCRGDLLELINFCSQNDISPLITTNGTIMTESLAKELRKNNPALINISLDGFQPQTHDKLRGIKGTYHKVMETIDHLKGKVPIQINTTIMDDNLDEILDLCNFAYRHKIQISFQGLINMTGGTEKLSFPKEHYLFPQDLKKLDYVISEVVRRKKYNKGIVNSRQQFARLKAYYHFSAQLKKKYCEIIASHIFIKQDGNLRVCLFREPIGNLANDSLKDIWKSERAAQTFREMRRCKMVDCLIFRGCYKEGYREMFNKVKNALCSA